MLNKRRFIVGAALIAAAVSYLVYAGIRTSSMYYFELEEFLAKRPEFTWPVGWGAMEFFDALPIEGIPTVLVFGRDGKLRWSATGAGQPGLESALDAALAEPGPPAAQPAS